MANNGLLSSPLLNIGLGLLADRGQASGAMKGLLQSQNMAYQQQIMQEMQRKAEQAAQQQDAAQRMASLASAQQIPGGGPLGSPQPAYAVDPQQQRMMQDLATAYPGVAEQMTQQTFAPQMQKAPAEMQTFRAFQGMSPEEQSAFLKYRQAAAAQTNIIPKPETGYTYKDPTNPQLGVTPIPGGSKEQGTGEQNKAAGFVNRMVTSEMRMGDVTGSGYNPANPVDAYGSKIPGLGNYVMSNEGQVYKQAQEDWVRAKLRKESGAVIGEGEMANEIKTYFPQPGDRPNVIESKRKARVEAIKGVYGESEGQYDRKFGEYGLSSLQSLMQPTGSPVEIPANISESEQDRIYESLKSGTIFVGPDGVKRKKP